MPLTKLTLAAVSEAPLCLLKVISGSHSYGLAMPHSDLDMRGVFMAPQQSLYGLGVPQQISDEKKDTTFFELGRFVDLALKNNPNMLELLGTPADCVQIRHPLMEKLRPELFLSKRCRDSFAGYAIAQIKRARGLNKKIVNPMPEARKTVVDFCHVPHGQGTVPLTRWMEEKGLPEKQLGLTELPHIRDGYAIYHDPTGAWELRGFLSSVSSTYLSTSKVPYEAQPIATMVFNKDGYAKHCKDWQEYQIWLAERNVARYEATQEHGKGYDAKNMMHTFRLLDLAQQVAETGSLTVRCANREELLKIRRGEQDYDFLLQEADRRIAEIDDLFARSSLPAAPNEAVIEEILVEIRQDFYRNSGT